MDLRADVECRIEGLYLGGGSDQDACAGVDQVAVRWAEVRGEYRLSARPDNHEKKRDLLLRRRNDSLAALLQTRADLAVGLDAGVCAGRVLAGKGSLADDPETVGSVDAVPG